MDSGVKHIVLLTGQHMVANPRVWKEANCLYQHGYKVTVLTTFYDAQKLAEDRSLLLPGIHYQPAINLIEGQGSFAERVLSRVWRRAAMLLKKITGADSSWLLMYGPKYQLKQALKIKADLFIAHQEAGLLLGCELLKHHRKVAIDIEDWYSRDYINKYRPTALLAKKESYASKHAAYFTCPSKSMATAIAAVYEMKTEPHVIYNGFSIRENLSVNTDVYVREQSLVWFSQVVGPERGLETLMHALNHIDNPVSVHFLGQLVSGYDVQLKSLLTKEHTLVFHAPVSHNALHPFLRNYKVGLAIEKKQPDSRNTTITNKILQYVQAGNFVLATDTAGQQEIAAAFDGHVQLVKENDPLGWSIVIKELLEKPFTENNHVFDVFSSRYSWEAQEQTLLSLVDQAVSN